MRFMSDLRGRNIVAQIADLAAKLLWPAVPRIARSRLWGQDAERQWRAVQRARRIQETWSVSAIFGEGRTAAAL